MHHLFDRWLPQWDIFITAHQLRRTFATHMMRSNAKLRDIQLLLGHAKLSTSDSYLDSNAQERSDSVNLLPSYQ
jgi:site-specific recombinase XerD